MEERYKLYNCIVHFFILYKINCLSYKPILFLLSNLLSKELFLATGLQVFIYFNEQQGQNKLN